MKVAIFAPNDLSDDWLRWATQIGVDYLDIDNPTIPGLQEQGYPDMDKLLKLERRIRSWGLRINRVTLPSTPKFMLGQAGGEKEIDNVCKTIECVGKAHIPIGRPVFSNSMDSPIRSTHAAEHRGGYAMRAFDLELWKSEAKKPSTVNTTWEEYWNRCMEVYSKIVPVAEESGVKLALHPSDVPLPESPFSSLGYHRILDAFPSENNGLLYCVGTRHEAGGTQLVLDEVNYYGRKGKIFEVHFRNVRGSLATAGGFEEVLLDDGDMNMFKIIEALDKIGFEGALNPDHVPLLAGDTNERRMAWSYSVGYIKALLATLATLP